MSLEFPIGPLDARQRLAYMIGLAAIARVSVINSMQLATLPQLDPYADAVPQPWPTMLDLVAAGTQTMEPRIRDAIRDALSAAQVAIENLDTIVNHTWVVENEATDAWQLLGSPIMGQDRSFIDHNADPSRFREYIRAGYRARARLGAIPVLQSPVADRIPSDQREDYICLVEDRFTLTDTGEFTIERD